MPRPPRTDEAGGRYHALNRGNLRATIFHKDADFEAFERILESSMPLWGFANLSGGTLFVSLDAQPLSFGAASFAAAVRLSAQRGKPLGDPDWIESIASRLDLESTIRPRGRQQIRVPQPPIKEA